MRDNYLKYLDGVGWSLYTTAVSNMGLLPSDPNERKLYLLGLQIAGDFGATIAVPIVVFVLLGRWLDEKYLASPRYTILAFILAAALSARIIYKKAIAYSKLYQSLIEKKKPGDKNQR